MEFSAAEFSGGLQGHLWIFPEQLAKNVTQNDISIRFRISERIFVPVRIPEVPEVGQQRRKMGHSFFGFLGNSQFSRPFFTVLNKKRVMTLFRKLYKENFLIMLFTGRHL